jgi:rhodanese-related sulfurtransferase
MSRRSLGAASEAFFPGKMFKFMKTYAELLKEAKARVREVSVDDAMKAYEQDDKTVFLDVREPGEWNLGRIPGAVFIPRGQLERDVEGRVPRDARVIVYCASGNRSAFAAETLTQMGYTDVASLSAGWKGWAMAGGPVED